MLVTRPQHQSDAFAAGLERAGATVILAPVIAFEPPDDRYAAEQAVNQASHYAWIVFTSANGVSAFFELMDSRREDARLFGAAKIAAIGSATASALRKRGIYADLLPARYVAEDLADALLTATKPGERILIFRAQEARDVLPDRMRADGRDVDVVAAYKTVTVRDDAFEKKVASSDIVTFTSSSTVRGFLENGGAGALSDRTQIACIGPVTAQTARDAGLRVDVVASTYTSEGLIAALEAPTP